MSNFLKSLCVSSAVLTIAACSGGGGGSSGGGGGTTTDRTAPSVSFNPNVLTVVGRETGDSTLTATDNVGVTSSSVTCDNDGSFANNVFTAPDVDVETTVICTATARDGAGNVGTARLTVTVTPGADITDPTLTVTPPATTIVASGGTADLIVSATDNRGDPTVTVNCDNGGTWANDVFTAPTVTTDTTVTCIITAEDDGGNSVSDTVEFTIEPPDTTNPTASFNPTTISLDSAQTANVVLTSDDNVSVTMIDVVCDNGGSWENDVYTAPTTTSDLTDTCTATVSDAAGNQVTASFTASVTGVATPTSVKISGQVTFDLVPLNTTTNGLDYDATIISPSRGVTVQAVDGASAVLATTVTDENGNYSLDVNPNTDIRIRALAEMIQTTGAQWDVKVVSDDANNIYAIQGSLTSSGATDTTRNLRAQSGWGGTSYTGTRAAGPFAILDSIYKAVTKFAAVDPDIVFPELFVDWSPQNNEGSFYTQGRITILGDENNDTDEYDDHVVVHEWGHYFEDQLSRADSIGGQHTISSRLDPRVAFGEGWGNALSGMILDDPFYRDSNSAQQASGFSVNVERNSNTNAGWFNEGSVQSILYDLYDSDDDGSDTISLGLGPIYEVLVDPNYTGAEYFTTIFLFADMFKAANSGEAAVVDALLSAQSIDGTGPDGDGETNDGNVGGTNTVLPVYNTITQGQTITVCSLDNTGEYNKLGIRAYVEFTPTATGNYTITMTKTSGPAERDPDFNIFDRGNLVAQGRADSTTSQLEELTTQLTGGRKYIIDAFDWQNIGSAFGSTTVTGDSCYDFTIN